MLLVQKQPHRSMQTESSEINPHTYDQLIYNKGGKTIQWLLKDSLQVVLGKLDRNM